MRLKNILLTLVGLLLFPATLRAQFIGYDTPQTIQANLGTNVACTGSQQNFVMGAIAGFNNLGQTQHYITLRPSAAVISVKAEIDGIDLSNNLYRISDVLVESGIPSLPLTVSGSGYFPVIQISVTCGSSAGTFSLNYTGASSTANVNAGSYLLAQIDKALFAGAPANTTATVTFQPPFGSSGGTLLFNFSGAGPAGSTVAVACSGLNIGLNSQTFPLATAAGTQILQVSNGICPSEQITFNSGGASAVTYAMEYIFAVPGSPSINQDPCGGASFQKQSVPINVTTATTTQLVSAVAGETVYPCGVSITIAPSGTTADTALFEYGTTASCAAGTTALTGAFGAGDLTTTTGLLPITLSGPGTIMKIPISNGWCMVSAGTTINIQGVAIFVQQ